MGWSGSIISRTLPTTFGGPCIILHAKRNRLLCAFPWDMGTMTGGCEVGNDRYAPDELDEMMKERKAMTHNGTAWHVPKSSSDCVLGPKGEVSGQPGCKMPPVAKALAKPP